MQPKRKQRPHQLLVQVLTLITQHVSHDIHCERGSTEKCTKVIFKLKSHCVAEDCCSWRCEIRDLLVAKESLGPVAFDLKKKLILSCMKTGEKADLFSTKCEEHMVEELRQLGQQAAQEAAAAAAEGGCCHPR